MNKDDPFYTYTRRSDPPEEPTGSQVVFARGPEGAYAAPPARGGGGAVSAHPFRVQVNDDGDAQILSTTASYLHENYLAASGLTITALNTAFALASNTHAWIEVAIDSYVEITASELKTGTAFPEPFVSSGSVQTQYNIPVGRVVADAQPGMPGFDFTISSTAYHWQQLLREHQIMESYCFSGVPGLKAFPWQGI